MAREIKFRGESMGSNWIYGLLTKKKIRNSGKISYAIAKDDCSSGNTVPVVESSIGEFTGFKDIDDKEIYEGDIVQNEVNPREIYQVAMVDGSWSVLDETIYSDLHWFLNNVPIEVIGNIHDNPELLEGGEADD